MLAILRSLNYSLVLPDRPWADLVIAWEDTTFPSPRQHPGSRWGVPPINGRCLDISKRHVDSVHARVFGYPVAIDPATHAGTCLEKSDTNARHDARIVECRGARPASGKVYQRFVDTLQPQGYYEDIRIAVVCNEVPFCWRRLSAVDGLQDKLAAKFEHSIPVPTGELLSPEEVKLVLRFSAELGLDFAEFDGGRDRADGRLYLYDANATSVVRSESSTNEERRLAIKWLAAAFARQFQPRITFAGEA